MQPYRSIADNLLENANLTPVYLEGGFISGFMVDYISSLPFDKVTLSLYTDRPVWVMGVCLRRESVHALVNTLIDLHQSRLSKKVIDSLDKCISNPAYLSDFCSCGTVEALAKYIKAKGVIDYKQLENKMVIEFSNWVVILYQGGYIETCCDTKETQYISKVLKTNPIDAEHLYHLLVALGV